MAVVFFEGFDHYPTTETPFYDMINGMSGKWASCATGPYCATDTPYADGVGQSLRNVNAYYDNVKSEGFSISGNKIIISFWFKPASNDSSSNQYYSPMVLQTEAGASVFGMQVSNNTPNMWWKVGPASGSADRWHATTIVLTMGAWRHWAVEVDLATDATGRVKIFDNGVEILDLQNVKTAENMSASYRLQIGYGSSPSYSNNQFYIDDLVVLDGSGANASTNQFPGIMRVLPLKATADDEIGANSTASSGGAKYLDIDDTVFDASATTYVSSDTTGERNLYSIEDANVVWGNIEAVLGVEVASFNGTVYNPSSTVRNVIDDGTNSIEGADHTLTTVAPAVCPDMFTTAPDAGDWTLADLQNLNIGHKHQS